MKYFRYYLAMMITIGLICGPIPLMNKVGPELAQFIPLLFLFFAVYFVVLTVIDVRIIKKQLKEKGNA